MVAKLQPRRQAKEPQAKVDLGGKIYLRYQRPLQGPIAIVELSHPPSTEYLHTRTDPLALDQFPVVNSKSCPIFQFPLLAQISSMKQKYLDFPILG